MKFRGRIADFIFSGKKTWKERAAILWFALSFCFVLVSGASWFVLVALVSLVLSARYLKKNVEVEE